MAVAPLKNSFEGGTNGVAISNANSGGASGDIFSTVNGTLALFSNDVHGRGAMVCKIIDPTAGTSVNWTGLGSLTASFYARAYFYLTAYPTTSGWHAIRVATNAAITCAYLDIQAGTGLVRGLNAAGSAIAGSTGTVPIALNQWVRLEMRVLPSTTVGEFEWRLFNTAESVTADETKNATGAVLGANIDQVYYGVGATTPATPFTVIMDDIACDASAWVGPIAPPRTRPYIDVFVGS